jgi:hypothetical protein
MFWFKFLLDIAVKSWFVAIAVAVTEFVVTGNHIGNASFLDWMGIAFLVISIFKVIDMIEIYYKLKDMHNGN